MPGFMNKAFIGDGDKHDLPLANKDNKLGSPSPLIAATHQKKGSGASYRSGSAVGTKETTGSETGSNV